jgi:hypothetical protein
LGEGGNPGFGVHLTQHFFFFPVMNICRSRYPFVEPFNLNGN